MLSHEWLEESNVTVLKFMSRLIKTIFLYIQRDSNVTFIYLEGLKLNLNTFRDQNIAIYLLYPQEGIKQLKLGLCIQNIHKRDFLKRLF